MMSEIIHRRYFRIAGITVCMESDLNLGEMAFRPELELFAVDGPGDDNVILCHKFALPELAGKDLGKELYRKSPWMIYRDPQRGTWMYLYLADVNEPTLHYLATFNATHASGTIYNRSSAAKRIRKHGWPSLTLFPTDQIWLAPLLAERHAVLMHSAAAIVNDRGLVFIGHSEAGKSTTARMLKDANLPGLNCEILCDDRNVIRKWPTSPSSPGEGKGEGEWRVHGTWSHGDVSDVSPASAPLAAILFLQQDTQNEIALLTDRKGIWKRLLATLIRPMVSVEWWQKELDVLQEIVNEVPCYTMRFNKSGAIVTELMRLIT